VRKDLDAGLKKKLKGALLSMHDDPQGKDILKSFGALRFIETTAGDYRPVSELAARAGIDLRRYQYRNE
jgi:ABC-type phosphate/phosphonate transport system substrate-binding protein